VKGDQCRNSGGTFLYKKGRLQQEGRLITNVEKQAILAKYYKSEDYIIVIRGKYVALDTYTERDRHLQAESDHYI